MLTRPVPRRVRRTRRTPPRPKDAPAPDMIGPADAVCDGCEMREQCDRGAFAPGAPPTEPANGLMIIGEGPGMHEVARKTPFVGRSGQLLDRLLQEANLSRDATHITNATLCQPPVGAKDRKSLHQAFPNALLSCQPRLRKELELAQPRVVLALGAAALTTCTAERKSKTTRIPFDCPACLGARKVGPVIECTARRRDTGLVCGWMLCAEAGATDPAAWLLEHRPATCPQCDGALTRQKPKLVKCKTCKGLKTRPEVSEWLSGTWKITEAAGAIFDAQEFPLFAGLRTEYLIATYHPAFCLHAPKGDRGFGGQYVVNVLDRHIRKVSHLLGADPAWDVGAVVTDDPEVVVAFLGDRSRLYATDIETTAFRVDPSAEDTTALVEADARDPWQVTQITCIGFAHKDSGDALVVDTREVFEYDHVTKEIYVNDGTMFDALKDVLEDGTIKKSFQNGIYDVTVLFRFGIEVDGYDHDTLVAHHVLYPDEPHDLGHIVHSFTDAYAWKPPATQKKTKGFAHYDFGDLADYNAQDTYGTAVALDRMVSPKLSRLGLMHEHDVREVYDLDMAMQRIACAMTVDGLPLDSDEVRRAGIKAQRDAAMALCDLREMINDPEFNPGSPKQLSHVLYSPQGLNLVPPGRTKKGAPSTAAGDLVKLSHIPFVAKLLAYRAPQKIVSTYVTGDGFKPGDDGRMHPVWKVTGTRTGRWSSSKPNCFDGATEVLTPAGWVRFDALDPASLPQVAQFSTEDGRLSWTRPTGYIAVPTASFLQIKTRAIDLQVTADHRCLLYSRSRVPEVVPACDYAEDRRQLCAAEFTDVCGGRVVPHDLLRLLCATQADGSYVGRQIDFCFSKKRKIGRLLALTSALGIAVHVRPKGADVTRITLQDHRAVRWIKDAMPAKVLPWHLLQLSRECREVFCDELFRWDGCSTRMNHYSSSVRQNVDVAQALLVTSGIRARVRTYYSRAGANPNYQIDVSRKDYSWTTNRTITEVPGGLSYCVSVPSSYIMVRRNGCVAITGQCQNLPIWYRSIVVAPKKRAIVGADYSQLELRIMAALSGSEELIQRCATADESRKLEPDHDPHSFVAALTFGDTFTALKLKDPEHDKTNARCTCDTCVRKALRDIIKRTVYGLNYGAGAATVLDAIYAGGYHGPPIALSTIERTTRVFFDHFPEVPRWRDEQVAQARQTCEIRSPLLCRRRVFPLGDVDVTVVYNFPIQSGAADIMNTQFRKFAYELPSVDATAFPIAQVHDAIYVECSVKHAEAVARLMTETLSCALSLLEGAPAMPFVAAAKVGAKWSEVS